MADNAVKPLSYVEQREATLKEQFRVEMWWVTISKMWEKLARAAEHKRRADLNMDAFNAIRAEFVKKGRKPGYSPTKAKAA